MLSGKPLDIAAGAWWSRTCIELTAARGGRTQRQVAAAIGTGQGTYWAYEHATVVPRMGKATTWAGHLGCRLAITRGVGWLHQMHELGGWNADVGRHLAERRNRTVFPSGPHAGRTHTQRSLAAATGMALATVQGVESARDVLVTTWAAYVFAIGWEPVLLGRDGARACHTR